MTYTVSGGALNSTQTKPNFVCARYSRRRRRGDGRRAGAAAAGRRLPLVPGLPQQEDARQHQRAAQVDRTTRPRRHAQVDVARTRLSSVGFRS